MSVYHSIYVCFVSTLLEGKCPSSPTTTYICASYFAYIYTLCITNNLLLKNHVEVMDTANLIELYLQLYNYTVFIIIVGDHDTKI